MTTKTTAIECPHCNGRKTIMDQVEWSDGLGQVEAFCPLCDGKGMLPMEPMALLLKYKQDAAIAKAQLRELKIHVALYLETEQGRVPNPPLVGAGGPSPYAETWREHLRRAVANLPRVAPEGDAMKGAR